MGKSILYNQPKKWEVQSSNTIPNDCVPACLKYIFQLVVLLEFKKNLSLTIKQLHDFLIKGFTNKDYSGGFTQRMVENAFEGKEFKGYRISFPDCPTHKVICKNAIFKRPLLASVYTYYSASKRLDWQNVYKVGATKRKQKHKICVWGYDGENERFVIIDPQYNHFCYIDYSDWDKFVYEVNKVFITKT